MTVALYDMDRVGTHDFLGAVELVGDELMNFVAQPLDHLPKWEITGTSRIKVSSIGLCKQCTHLFVVGVDIQTPQQPATGGK